MSEITLTPISNYALKLQSEIIKYEGDVRRIYSDPVGIPTMGIGFALFDRKVDSVTKVETYTYRGGTKEVLIKQLTSAK